MGEPAIEMPLADQAQDHGPAPGGPAASPGPLASAGAASAGAAGPAESSPEHRRRTARHVRHEARARLRQLAQEREALDDADLLCPQGAHDLGRKTSRPPRAGAKPGRRGGFKVWKTPFWKRRKRLRAARNAELRRLAEEA
jgi:hypothetical protein